jgi:dipeptidyl aminopeptidase/acylaminoacyl peptidase
MRLTFAAFLALAVAGTAAATDGTPNDTQPVTYRVTLSKNDAVLRTLTVLTRAGKAAVDVSKDTMTFVSECTPHPDASPSVKTRDIETGLWLTLQPTLADAKHLVTAVQWRYAELLSTRQVKGSGGCEVTLVETVNGGTDTSLSHDVGEVKTLRFDDSGNHYALTLQAL